MLSVVSESRTSVEVPTTTQALQVCADIVPCNLDPPYSSEGGQDQDSSTP